MSYYNPDSWVIIHMKGDQPHYKVLAGWSGGYTTGDSWRMNSGITECIEEDDHWLFIGTSGSTYACHKDTYGLKMSTAGIWNRIKELHGDKVELMEDSWYWSDVDWIIK